MKKLLIHNNNTPLNAPSLFSFEDQFVFEVDLDKDVDHYIHEKISFGGELAEKIDKSDILFVKISLSPNYLEYLGLRLAYHIRLSTSLVSKRGVPIVLLGDEGIQFLGITAKDPLILFTKGMYLAKDTPEGIQKVQEWIDQGIIKPMENIEEFEKSVTVDAPASYRSHHSITNEWSILRWATVMGISEQLEFNEVKKNIDGLLYYKYLSRKYPIAAPLPPSSLTITSKGKLLYIDDEWQKGWNIIFASLFRGTGVDFRTLENDFKNSTKEQVVQFCLEEVEKFDPEVVILDLRLSDSDFDNLKCSEMAGHMVLKAIKKFNPGIQVIIFSASNKVWNLSELQVAGSDGFVLKESPELSIDGSYSADALLQVANLIEKSLEMSFLKNVHLHMAAIGGLATGLSGLEKKDFSERLGLNFEISFQLLKQVSHSAKYFNHAYLQLFQIIEDFSSIPSIFEGTEDCYVGDGANGLLVRKLAQNKTTDAINFAGGRFHLGNAHHNKEIKTYPETNFKVSALIVFRLGLPNSSYLNWTNIYTNRNQGAAHFNETDKIGPKEIEQILTFITGFIDESKKSTANHGRALQPESIADKLKQLQEKFQR